MTTKATDNMPAKATTAKVVATPAVAKKTLVKSASKTAQETVRTSHADCDHPKSGREAKAARAACRRERAAAEAKA